MLNKLIDKFLKSVAQHGVWLDADQARKIHNICLIAKNSTYRLTDEEWMLVLKLGERIKEMK